MLTRWDQGDVQDGGRGKVTWKFQGRDIPSSSVASSGLVTRELLDAERFRKPEILRKKPDFVLPTGLWVGWGDDARARLGAGDGLRTEEGVGLGVAEEMEMREGLIEVE